jgi:hypothetical protein
MKTVKKSSTHKFGAGAAQGISAISPRKKMAMNVQGATAAVKNPKGSKGKKLY